MADQVTNVVLFDDAQYQRLMEEYKTLSTFAAVSAWDDRATRVVTQITDAIITLNGEVAALANTVEQAKREHAQRPLFQRALGDRSTERNATAQIEKYQAMIVRLESLADEMQTAIDFTPGNVEEKRALVKELRLHKKELQLNKREIAASIKGIQLDARKKLAGTDDKHVATWGSWAQYVKRQPYERRQIRYAKSAAVGAHEDEKAAIERQLLQVERDILRAERFEA